jgi:hypothetical protein
MVAVRSRRRASSPTWQDLTVYKTFVGSNNLSAPGIAGGVE